MWSEADYNLEELYSSAGPMVTRYIQPHFPHLKKGSLDQIIALSFCFFDLSLVSSSVNLVSLRKGRNI